MSSRITESLLANSPSEQVESSLIATMSDTYEGNFALATKLDQKIDAFRIVETARGRGYLFRGMARSLPRPTDHIWHRRLPEQPKGASVLNRLIGAMTEWILPERPGTKFPSSGPSPGMQALAGPLPSPSLRRAFLLLDRFSTG